ncbi:hypothetical protein ARC78_07550 [Stenotrophomonas pictorum JCM 9942]|uniref:Resolvase HTH domain-containing protein n=1 Tax=Stenotrophomonas pictorum JCM 9942 TaxID=1236960 RepID=A0A0R0AE61_9GAMM|nr:helix-turn-helix domain-containing protein [Stenotrophomonas pictorum]KRG43212.1 hypothetical protein ARC78_07550 [Stenotrophomonas pictorum JCM 9942]
MSNTRDIDAVENLRRLVVRGIVEQTGLNEEHAMPYATAVVAVLQTEFGGERLHIPKAPPSAAQSERQLRIQRDLESGMPVNQVRIRHGVSRSTLHRMFPGGLPKKSA